MLGTIQISFADYLASEFGAEKLEEILVASNLEGSSTDEWEAACPYSDSIVYSMLEAAAAVTGETETKLAFGYGRHFIKWSCGQGYDKLLSLLGRNLVEFLSNLNNLHLALSVSMPAMEAPDFTIQKITPKSLELHYKSTRKGLGPMMEGIIITIAQDMFDTTIEMKLLRGRADGSSDHEVYLVTFPMDNSFQLSEARVLQQAAENLIGIEPSLFYKAFPYHFVLDEHCRMAQIGSGLQRLYPDLKIGSKASDYFKIRLPSADWDYDLLCEYERSPFVLRSKTGLEFKGQVISTNIPERSAFAAAAAATAVTAATSAKCKGPHSDSPPIPSLQLLPLQLQIPHVGSPSGGPSPSSYQLPHYSTTAPQLYGTTPLQHYTSSSITTPSSKQCRRAPHFASIWQSSGQANQATAGRIRSCSNLELPNLVFQSTPSSKDDVAQPQQQLSPVLRLSVNGHARFRGEGFTHAHSASSLDGFKRQPGQKAKGLLFIGSPRVMDLDELKAHDIYLSDLPLHDMCSEFVVLAEQRKLMGEAHKQLEMHAQGLEREAGLGRKREAALNRSMTAILAAQNDKSTEVFEVNTPAELALDMMDRVLRGHEISSVEAVQLRDAIITAGLNLRQPMDIFGELATLTKGEEDVKRSLMNLLVDNNQTEDDDEVEEIIRNLGVHHAPDIKPSPFARAQHRNLDAASNGSNLDTSSNSNVHASNLHSSDGIDNRDAIAMSFSVGDPTLVGGRSRHRSIVCFGDFVPSPPGETYGNGRSSISGSHLPTMFSNNSTLSDGPPQLVSGSLAPDFLEQSYVPITSTRSIIFGDFLPAPPSEAHGNIKPSIASSSSVPIKSSITHSNGPSRTAFGLSMGHSVNRAIGQSGNAVAGEFLKTPTDKVNAVLAKVHNWQFDSFELAEVSEGRPLSMLAFALMKKAALVSGKLAIKEAQLAGFLCRIEDGYRDHPYHSKIHAADVLRTMHVLLHRGEVLNTVASGANRDINLLSCYLAAVVHDFEHKGFNNDFLVKSGDTLALTYNDKSPMENHHLAAAFKLMKEDRYNFLKDTPAKFRELRKLVVDLVLATDMKQHFGMVSQFNSNFWIKAQQSLPASSEQDSAPLSYKRLDEETRLLITQVLMKCADLGHLGSARSVHLKWVSNLEEELFRQGDEERRLGLSISPLMDRKKQGITKSQPGFFSIVATPLYLSFSNTFPACTPLLDAVTDNLQMWKKNLSHRTWNKIKNVTRNVSRRSLRIMLED